MDTPAPDAQIQPNEQQVFLTLRKLGAADDEAFGFVQGTESMAGRNVIAAIRVLNARLNAALETQNAKLDAQANALDALQREINSRRWTIGLGFTALAVLITVLSLLA